MDDLNIRLEHLLTQLQFNLQMASEHSIRIMRQASDETRELAMRVIHDPTLNTIKDNAESVWQMVIEILNRMGEAIKSPNVLLDQFNIIFRDEIARNNTYFVLCGLGVGTMGGCMLGMWLARKNMTNPIMKSVACLSFVGPDNVTLCKTILPQLHSTADILVRVRAASINRLDVEIAHGYGRTLRSILQSYSSYNPELPLVIGRSCSGVVENVGKDAQNGLEIGDEVWLASPFYESGLASQLVVAHESRVARKPVLIGFEGAASLPYDGCVALAALKEANISENTSMGKRILIQDGCSPVGCILTQLIKKWGGYVVVTCHQRSAPVVNALGADEIITFSNDSFEENFYEKNIEQSTFLNELVSRERYDVVFFTTHLNYDTKFINKFLNVGGIVVHATEKHLVSDEYGSFMKMFFGMYVHLKKFGSKIFGFDANWADEPHLCHFNLNQLASFVNTEVLNTVVDQVYNPNEAERAVAHLASEKRIGSTIITFR